VEHKGEFLMSLQDIITKYKISDDEVTEINGLIQAEKDKGISESKKKNKEVLEVKTELNKIRDMLRGNLDLDPDGDLEEQAKVLKEKLEKSTAKAEAGSLAELEDRLKKDFDKRLKESEAKAQKQIDTEKAEKEAVASKFRNSKISQILKKAMGDQFIGSDLAIKDFIRENKVKLTDDETVIFVDGDDEVELAKGLEKFKKDNPDLVRNTQSPGSGGGSKSTVDVKNKKIAEAEWLQKEPKERARLMADGYTLT
jgi:hypothetical protein